MKRYFLSLLALVALTLTGLAQQMPQLTPLPLNPQVKTGVLPNGLTYFVMHNSEPKERANFYIAQKVGSTLENQDQLGLAHFLEHMAFNGTTHYPGKEMLNYLQNKGIRFGTDINAYTAFDETVYRINNVPTTDRPLMDSVLLVLRDWSDGIALMDSEIEAERGVIQEEWRQRNDANSRMMEAVLPQIYSEYQYQQTPIGKMEVVMNFKPEVLRAYYKKWYRPDQQGIIVVGDFDADEMEKKVIALFSDVQMIPDAAERVYPHVSDNAEPIVATFSDKEMQFPYTRIFFKFDKTPFELRNTAEVYLQDDVLQTVISSMINERLNEYQQDPACPYVYAGFAIGDFFVAKTKGAVTLMVVPKEDMAAAVGSAVAKVAEALKGGFNQAEWDRACERFVASLEKMYNERNTTDSHAFGQELTRFFVDNAPAPGIETEYQMVKMALPTIPLEAVNQIGASILEPTNEVFIVVTPEGVPTPDSAAIVAATNDALNAQYEAKIEEVITEPLIAKLPKPGKIVKQTTNPNYGAEVLTLSNGVKVIVKTTDFKSDEIKMEAFREGGKRSYLPEDGINVQLVADAVDNSNLGSFDPVKLRKYLSGKHVGVNFDINNYTDVMNGMSNVKDLPTLMELVYATFTSLNPNPEVFNVQMQQAITLLQNIDKDPRKVFKDAINKGRYGDNLLLNELTADMISKVDYNRALEIAKQAMSNAADYTFIFTGNVDIATLKPLLEQYIATLPSKKKARKTPVLTDISFRQGEYSNEFAYPNQSPSVSVFEQMSGANKEYNAANDIMMSLTSDILEMIYTETLREEMGGTYGAGVGGGLNPNSGRWTIVYNFDTNPDQRNAMIERSETELNKLLKEGANPEHFNRVKEAMIKQYEMQLRDNSYWMGRIFNTERGFDIYSDYEKILNNLTIDQLNAFMKDLYDGTNHIKVVMDAAPVE